MPAIKHARMQRKFQFARERKIATFESIRGVQVVISYARALMTCECVKLDARTSAPVQQAAPTYVDIDVLFGGDVRTGADSAADLGYKPQAGGYTPHLYRHIAPATIHQPHRPDKQTPCIANLSYRLVPG